MRHADQAMYIAKQAGRNRYHIFDATMDRNMQLQLGMRQRIIAALDAGEFCLHYQPKVNLREGRVIGAEALIRWQHPERGIIAPGEFLPQIDDNDSTVQLSEWVIDTALAQMEQWRAAGAGVRRQRKPAGGPPAGHRIHRLPDSRAGASSGGKTGTVRTRSSGVEPRWRT